MSFIFRPWHLLGLNAAGAAQQDYRRAIDYLMAENRVLKNNPGNKTDPTDLAAIVRAAQSGFALCDRCGATRRSA